MRESGVYPSELIVLLLATGHIIAVPRQRHIVTSFRAWSASPKRLRVPEGDERPALNVAPLQGAVVLPPTFLGFHPRLYMFVAVGDTNGKGCESGSLPKNSTFRVLTSVRCRYEPSTTVLGTDHDHIRRYPDTRCNMGSDEFVELLVAAFDPSHARRYSGPRRRRLQVQRRVVLDLYFIGGFLVRVLPSEWTYGSLCHGWQIPFLLCWTSAKGRDHAMRFIQPYKSTGSTSRDSSGWTAVHLDEKRTNRCFVVRTLMTIFANA